MSYKLPSDPSRLHHHLLYQQFSHYQAFFIVRSILIFMAPAISDTFDLTKFVVKNGNGVKGLAKLGLESIPKQYIQPVEERMDMQHILSPQQHPIPIIDMSNSNMADSICDAAEKWGFFQVINHGVPLEVLENMKIATHEFYGLPTEEKNKYTKENSPTKNVRYGTSFAPLAERSLEWKDYLSLFFTSEEDVSAFWPKECRDQAMEYMKKCEPMIKQLLQGLMGRLNVKETWDGTLESLLIGSKRINLNYYPKCPNPELTVGVGRHSDVSTLSILLQDDIGGLYVRGIDGNGWVHVPPISGSIVINIGDALQIMSNGRYKSVEHRVVANGRDNRISVPIFVNPKPESMIGPLPEVLENGEKAVYKQVQYSDYVRHFYSKAHDGKKTIDFAKI